MGRRADGTVAAVWGERLARQRRGTLSIAEFCRRERISPPSFYAWRRRLTEREAKPVAFIPVELPETIAASDGIQIELPGGAVVTLPAGASAELVTTAIRAAMPGPSAKERLLC